jgi:hypothetical protein
MRAWTTSPAGATTRIATSANARVREAVAGSCSPTSASHLCRLERHRVSSSGIIAKALADLGRVGNRETPAVLSVLVTEDLAMVVYLPLVGALLVGGGRLTVAGSLGIAALAAGLTLLAALRCGERIARLVEHNSAEVLLLSALGLVLLVSGLAERVQRRCSSCSSAHPSTPAPWAACSCPPPSWRLPQR